MLFLPTPFGKFRTSAFQFRPYHGTKLYNDLNQDITYEHNDNLNFMIGRQQFNFMAKNFSKCSQEQIEEFVSKTNSLGRNKNIKENDRAGIEL